MNLLIYCILENRTMLLEINKMKIASRTHGPSLISPVIFSVIDH